MPLPDTPGQHRNQGRRVAVSLALFPLFRSLFNNEPRASHGLDCVLCLGSTASSLHVSFYDRNLHLRSAWLELTM